jgi:N-acetylglucosaminyldiphosphoundecaprenol N-acetyl-beta-D-mannosaminyltransferase
MHDLHTGSVAILGVPIDNLTMDQVLGDIEASIDEGGFHQIATANVDFLINSIHDPELKEILSACHLVLPDGMPLVWASRLMGASLQERVSGSDLVPRLAELAARHRYGIFLLGSSEASSREAGNWISRNHPRARLVGRYCPAHAELDQMDHEDILLQIEAARPDILLVAFGSPKQEKWLAMHRHRLHVPVCIGVGGSLDLLAGQLPRAPLWMQRHGLEWLFRISREPARLGLRYARDAAGLAWYLTAQLAATAIQQRRRALNSIREETVGAATVLRVAGSITGSGVPGFEEEARLAVDDGQHLVLDLAATTYLGADALGALIHLGNLARDHHRELWLTGLRPFLRRLIHATQLDSAFRIAPGVADALRRMAPAEMQLSIESGKDWALCRIDGRLIPLRHEEAAELCRHVLQTIDSSHPVSETSRRIEHFAPEIRRERPHEGARPHSLLKRSLY